MVSLPSNHDMIHAVHAASARWVLALTGGGTSAAGELLAVPGGSRTIVEIVIPYHEQALGEFLGQVPASACNVAVSQAMARRALERTRWLVPGDRAFGLGCTASLVSDRPKRGEHRIHVSTTGSEALRTWSLTLTKGARDRLAEEALAAHLVLYAMAQTLGIPVPTPLPLLPGERIDETVAGFGAWEERLDDVGTLYVAADGRLCPELAWNPAQPMVLVPGAFNPLHAAHQALAALAEAREGKPAAFELSVTNVDKPPLSPEDVRCRRAAFAGRAPLWLTRAPRFLDKARLFPGATFVIGADTASRLVAPRYYDDDEHRLLQALEFFRTQRCSFLVAGRADATGRYLGLDDIPIPPAYRNLCRAIPMADFRMDISSTMLRARGEQMEARLTTKVVNATISSCSTSK